MDIDEYFNAVKSGALKKNTYKEQTKTIYWGDGLGLDLGSSQVVQGSVSDRLMAGYHGTASNMDLSIANIAEAFGSKSILGTPLSILRVEAYKRLEDEKESVKAYKDEQWDKYKKDSWDVTGGIVKAIPYVDFAGLLFSIVLIRFSKEIVASINARRYKKALRQEQKQNDKVARLEREIKMLKQENNSNALLSFRFTINFFKSNL